MVARKRAAPAAPAAKASTGGVEQFIAGLGHPHEDAIRALRAIIIGARKGIGEEVKWNAPSFRTTEHFATFHLRSKDGVQLVLHLGAKPRGETGIRDAIKDPSRLLQWRGADRATVTFRDLAEVRERADALTKLVREWIRFV